MQYLADNFGPADMRWCFWSVPSMTARGGSAGTLGDVDAPAMNPTLRVYPGDTLLLTLYNAVGQDPARPLASYNQTTCQSMVPMGTPHATNIHFHGFHVSALCTHDEVLHTMIGSGQWFTYRIDVPWQQPPGMYWYHPHAHGTSSSQVLGGASGAIVIESLETYFPAAVSGVGEQVLVLRSPLLPLKYPVAQGYPAWDVSVNRVDVLYPAYEPAVLYVNTTAATATTGNATGAYRQVWRILNACADRALNLSLVVMRSNVTAAVLPFTVVAVDGFPVERLFNVTFLVIPPAGRREVVVSIDNETASAASATNATSILLKTWKIDTGPVGDLEPEQPIARVVFVSSLPPSSPLMTVFPTYSGTPKLVNDVLPFNTNRQVKRRDFVFSEKRVPLSGDAATIFYLTEKSKLAASPEAFEMSRPPTVFVKIGTQEDWLIENVAAELHSFHIHQSHFRVLEYNRTAIAHGGPAIASVFGSTDAAAASTYDTIMLPQAAVGATAGSGSAASASFSSSNTSILLRMDFRGAIAGTGVFHCHMLVHEDRGMMQKVVFYDPTGTPTVTEGRTVSKPSATVTFGGRSATDSSSDSMAPSESVSGSAGNATGTRTTSLTGTVTDPGTRATVTATPSAPTVTSSVSGTDASWTHGATGTATRTLTLGSITSTATPGGASATFSRRLTRTRLVSHTATLTASHPLRGRHTHSPSAAITKTHPCRATPTRTLPLAPPTAAPAATPVPPPVVLDGIEPSDVAMPVGIAVGVALAMLVLFRYTCRRARKAPETEPGVVAVTTIGAAAERGAEPKGILFFHKRLDEEEMDSYAPPTVLQYAGRAPPPIPLHSLYQERWGYHRPPLPCDDPAI